MADIVTPQTPHIERPFGWKTWRVTPEALTGVTDVTVATLPADTVVLGGRIVCISGDVGATASTVDVEIGTTGAGDTELMSGGADFLGTAGATESAFTDANLSVINANSLGGSDLVVNAEVTYSGTATSAPVFEVSLLCGRNEI